MTSDASATASATSASRAAGSMLAAAQLLRLRDAQRPRARPRLHAGGGRCWVELDLDRPFEGWEGIAHGGIMCTILDEVMAWALVERGQLGRDRPDDASSSGSPSRSGARSAAEGWVTAVAAAARRRPRADRRPTTGDDLATRRRDLRRRPRRAEGELKGATVSGGARRGRQPSGRGRRMSRDARRSPVSPTTQRARASSPSGSTPAVALGRRAWRGQANDPAGVRRRVPRGLRARSPIPSTWTVSGVSRPGIGPVHGVRKPLLTARQPRPPRATRRDRPQHPAGHRRPPPAAGTPRAALAGVRPA